MKFIRTEGGPLVALPAEIAKRWCGTEATPGSGAPPGWTWTGNDDEPVRTDYDRACGKLRASHEGYCGDVGLLRVGDGDALVLSGPTDTTFLALPDGGAFLRNVEFPDARAARRAVDRAPKWKKTRVEFALSDGRLLLLDAVYPYPGAVKTKLGRPAMLTAKLGPGRYRVVACYYEPEGADDYILDAYRLVRA